MNLSDFTKQQIKDFWELGALSDTEYLRVRQATGEKVSLYDIAKEAAQLNEIYTMFRKEKTN